MYHPLWLTGVGHWYLPINKELPSLCREYDGEELPAELYKDRYTAICRRVQNNT